MRKVTRLNLGSGRDYLDGWVNIDIDQDVKLDLVADLSSPFRFNTDSVDELRAYDILEHFTKEDGEFFLRECHRVLRVGGEIEIRTHSLERIIDQFSDDPWVMTHFIYGDTSETGIYGSHKYAYTRESLNFLLKKLGFKILSYQLLETNHVVIAKKYATANKQLRIGVIQQASDLGGAEEYMHSLIKEFISSGNTVMLATNLKKYQDLYHKEGIEIEDISHCLDIIGDWKGLTKSILTIPLATWSYSKLLHKYKKKKVDVILMSNFSDKLFVSLLSIFFNIPVVWIEYGPLSPVFKRNLYLPKVIYRALKGIPRSIIVPSKNTRSSLIKDARVSLSKLSVIACGTTIFPNRSKRKYARKDEVVIGNLSRLTREKGQQFIIQAASYIIKQVPGATFILAGDGPDTEYFNQLIKNAGLEKYFSLPGFVANKEELYSKIDIFVFPSSWQLEGFGVVLIEAMARGLPVVASDFGPVPEIITDGHEGLLFKVDDPKDLADKVTILAKNPKLRESLGLQGRLKAKKTYDIKRSAEKTLDILYEATL